MRSVGKYAHISKQAFEDLLLSMSPYVEFYGDFYEFDWVGRNGQFERVEGTIHEYCYFIPVDADGNIFLKIYSSIDKRTKGARPKGEDAIRVVVAEGQDARPIRPRFPKVKRIGNWKRNLRIRVSNALESLGVKVTCVCGKRMFLWRNTKDNRRFLGCSDRVCGRTKTFAV